MNNLWIYLSFLTTFISALLVILLKYIDNSHYDNNIFLSFAFTIIGLISLIYLLCNLNKTKKIITTFKPNLVYLLIFFCISIILNQRVLMYALRIAPNMGYCHLIVNLNVILTLVASYFLFKEKINIKTFIGILVTLFGVSMVIYYSNN